jgi:T5SS/PEP-CTERM-associated repeat protein
MRRVAQTGKVREGPLPRAVPIAGSARRLALLAGNSALLLTLVAVGSTPAALAQTVTIDGDYGYAPPPFDAAAPIDPAPDLITGQMFIGDIALGTMTIQNGGWVWTEGDGTIAMTGGQDSYEGTVTVTGTGSKWDVLEELIVGNGGRGTLIIENGGQVRSAYETPYYGHNDVPYDGASIGLESEARGDDGDRCRIHVEYLSASQGRRPRPRNLDHSGWRTDV